MDSATVFVVVITAGAIGMLAILEWKSRKQKRTAPPSEPNEATKPLNRQRR